MADNDLVAEFYQRGLKGGTFEYAGASYDYDSKGDITIADSSLIHEVVGKNNRDILFDPIQAAMSLVAKITLIEKLKELGDAAINKIIVTRPIDVEKGKNVSEHFVDRVLKDIITPPSSSWGLFKSTPQSRIQKAVAAAVGDVQNIKSYHDVTKIMDDIGKGLSHSPDRPSSASS